MLKKLFFLILFCFLYSQNSNENILTAEIYPAVYNDLQKTENGYEIRFDIYCSNIDEIAGVQFELPDNMNLTMVTEARTKDLNFEFHHNEKGLILGFSMSGDKIPPSANALNRSSTRYGNSVTKYDEDIICSIYAVYIPSNKDQYGDMKYEGQINCPIKTILASPKGERLAFTSIDSKLALSKYDNPRQIKVSFYE